MKKYKLLFYAFVILNSNTSFSQPFVDIVSFNYQTFSSNYKDNIKWKNKTDDYFFNFFLPKEITTGSIKGTFLLRLNTEMINSTLTSDSASSSKLYNVALPLGFQFSSKSKKLKTLVMVMPKVACDFNSAISYYDYQLGGVFLETFIPNEKLKIKAGLYYNREAFGDFFIPLVGVDWKVSERINLYGILPTNYKAEFNIVKNKLYAGLNFKSLTRSFRLSKEQHYNYVRYDEMQIKLFVDYFVYKKILFFGEVGYSIGKNPWMYEFNTNNVSSLNPVYTPLKSYPIFNLGVAYRIRMDFEKKD
jgi:hypothetical protein